MAMSDYYLCDQCGNKAIYNAHWCDDAEESEAWILIICKSCKDKGYQVTITAPSSLDSPDEG